LNSMKSLRQYLLALFACVSLHGVASYAQTQPSAPPLPQRGARAVEQVAAPQGWQRYEIHYAGGPALRIVLPSQPEEMSEKVPVGQFPAATQHLFTSADDSGVYVVGYLEGLPAELTDEPSARTSYFNGLWKGLVEGMSNELKRQGLPSEVVKKPLRELTVSGHKAQVQDFTIGGFAGTARAVLTGGNSFLLVHISFANTINAQGTSFLESFELRPKR
jgi:hypothetical protein